MPVSVHLWFLEVPYPRRPDTASALPTYRRTPPDFLRGGFAQTAESTISRRL
jgi:hypothetical protein